MQSLLVTFHVIAALLLLSDVDCDSDKVAIHGCQHSLVTQVAKIYGDMDYFRILNQSHIEMIQKQSEMIQTQSEMIESLTRLIETQSAMMESVSHLQRSHDSLNASLQRSHDSLNASLAAMEQSNDASFARVEQSISSINQSVSYCFRDCLAFRDSYLMAALISGIINIKADAGVVVKRFTATWRLMAAAGRSSSVTKVMPSTSQEAGMITRTALEI